MQLLQPAEFRARFCAEFFPMNHHYTGPPHAQQHAGEGSIFNEEGIILASYAAKAGGPVLEIGGDRGISSRYIEEGLRNSQFPELAYILSVDPLHRWSSRGYSPRIIHIHGRTDEVLLPGDFLWGFIDGDHSYESCLYDIAVALEHGCDSLFFHDTTPNHPPQVSGARRAILDSEVAGWELYDIPTFCGLVYAKRPD